ncbi:MAG TPA: type II secretion system protein [Pirellulales bacterium]|jgi:prepilin-type N-terminal cleavage/methylation domain-containing protein|nr:type II secretion system protein [Pirellulales bacterium]
MQTRSPNSASTARRAPAEPPGTVPNLRGLSPFPSRAGDCPDFAQSAEQNGTVPFSRAGLTLVELLVTISIIAILAGLFLGALQSATEEAKAMKTKSMIAKLNNLIMPRYDAYRTRRVPIIIAPTNSVNPMAPLITPQQAAKYRLDALHDLMRMEMPDRMTDIVYPPITSSAYDASGAIGTVTIARPSISQAYYQALVTAFGSPLSIGQNVNLANQGAECLYLIVTLGFVDELGGRDLFNEGSIGDTDSDGLSEFLDAWGTPIGFLRWAPGFTESELNGAGGTLAGQLSPTSLTAAGSPPGISSFGLARRNNAYVGKTITIFTPSTGAKQVATIVSSFYDSTHGTTTINVSGNGVTLNGNETFGIDPDPFDPMHVYPNSALVPTNAVPFALYPLIYSAGPDRTFGVLTDFSSTTPLVYATAAAQGTWLPNGASNYPFLTDAGSSDADYGQSMGSTKDITSEQSANASWESSGWLDNIHNHLIGTK